MERTSFRVGYNPYKRRRVGRVAEGGGLLNRYRVKNSIGGSNPPLSATELSEVRALPGDLGETRAVSGQSSVHLPS